MRKELIALLFMCLSFNLTAQWNQANLPSNGTFITDIDDINFVDDTVGFAIYNALNCEIIKTTDAGASWTCLVQSSTGPFRKVHFASNTIGYSLTSRLEKTTDGGSSWTTMKSKTSTFEILRDLYFVSASEGYIASLFAGADYGLVHKTSNSGNTWTTDTLLGIDRVESIHFPSADTGYIVGGLNDAGIIYQTYDSGSTWSRDSLSQIGTLLDVYFLNNDYGFAVGEKDGSNEIVKTTDAFQTWSYIAPGGSTGTNSNPHTFRSIFFTTKDTGYAVGKSSRAMFTVDSGSTWSNMNLAGDFWKVVFPNPNVGLITGDTGLMLRMGPPVITSIKNKEKSNSKLVIYPNPSSGKIFINSVQNKAIKIFSTKGQLIFEKNSLGIREELNLEYLLNGIYFIQVFDDNGFSRTKKLIIKK